MTIEPRFKITLESEEEDIITLGQLKFSVNSVMNVHLRDATVLSDVIKITVHPAESTVKAWYSKVNRSVIPWEDVEYLDVVLVD